jgi:hypothetical protein
VLGSGSRLVLPSGSAVESGLPVATTLALLLLLTPPRTWMLAAVSEAVLIAVRAEAELESTTTPPVVVKWALPPMLKLPDPVRFRAKIDVEPATVTVNMPLVSDTL